MATHTQSRLLKLIALFKLAKVVLCLVAVMALLRLLAPGELERVGDWVAHLPIAPGRRIGEHFLAGFVEHGPGRVRLAAAIAAGYGALFATEGIGLWLGKRWAEYLTVVATATGIPFELYEIATRPGALAIAALALNVVILVYLIQRVRHPGSPA